MISDLKSEEPEDRSGVIGAYLGLLLLGLSILPAFMGRNQND